MFEYTEGSLKDLAATVLRLSREKGATAAEVDLSESLGQNVQVRLQEIEHIEYQQDRSLDITVYVGQSKGRASTADFSLSALHSTVQAALDIARFTAQDAFAGLAEREWLATEIHDLDKYHEWHLNSEQAMALAQECEASALAFDERVRNSEGAAVQTGHYHYVYGNSLDFLQYQRGTRHSISCSVVAADDKGMERDYWYDACCDAQDLDSVQSIGQMAAQRTVRRLGSRTIKTGTYPIVFDCTVARSFIGHAIGALSGGALYRKTSFLLDSYGKTIFPAFINLREEPHIRRAQGSTYFDNEGVATQRRFVIENGIVKGYFLGSYSARKLGLVSTGNAGGAHNLYLQPTCATQADLLNQMGTGLLITELMGQGVNMLTGDYSRGAAGFWVENGVIVYPISEFTIAGNLKDMFLNIYGIADDALVHSSDKIGSIGVQNIAVAGQ